MEEKIVQQIAAGVDWKKFFIVSLYSRDEFDRFMEPETNVSEELRIDALRLMLKYADETLRKSVYEQVKTSVLGRL